MLPRESFIILHKGGTFVFRNIYRALNYFRCQALLAATPVSTAADRYRHTREAYQGTATSRASAFRENYGDRHIRAARSPPPLFFVLVGLWISCPAVLQLLTTPPH